MNYRPAAPEDYEAVRQFLIGAGWAHRVGDAERFSNMVAASDRTVVAWDGVDEGTGGGARVVGFARALCDGVTSGYISMVAVAESRRGEGVGRELVRRLMGDDEAITWVLRADRGSRGFWERLGFTPSSLAMERPRRLPPAASEGDREGC